MLFHSVNSLNVRVLYLKPSLLLAAAFALSAFCSAPALRAQCSSADGTESTYTSSDVISTPEAVNGGNEVVTTPLTSGGSGIYPSTITVSGVSGTVQCAQVELDNVSSPEDNVDNMGLYNAEVILVSPDGRAFVVMAGAGQPTDFPSSLTMTIGDGYNAMPTYDTGGDFPSSGSQSYAPTSDIDPDNSKYGLWTGELPDDPPSPAPSLSPISGYYPSLDASQTMSGALSGATSSGGWNLYLVDFNGDPVTINGWKLHLWVKASVASTTTTISTGTNPATPGNSVTYTATVTSGGSPVSGGTVEFYTATTNKDNAYTPISGCTAQAVSNGIATCTVTLSAASSTACTTFTGTNNTTQSLPAFPSVCQGNQSIYAAYSGSTDYSTSQSTDLTQVIIPTPVQSGDQWCSSSAIAIPYGGQSAAYPAVIPVSGYPAGTTVGSVTVTLNNLQSSTAEDGAFLLVAPGGGAHNLDFLDSPFNDSGCSDTTLTIDDNAGQYPGTTCPGGSVSYTPYDGIEDPENFSTSPASSAVSAIPAVPSTINYPGGNYSGGSAANTLTAEFNNAPANGDWALYAISGGGGYAKVNGGWCLNFTLNTGVATTTTVTPSANPAIANTSVTYTATVKAGGSPVTSGTVTFLDNGATPTGITSGANTVTLNASGQATFSFKSVDQVQTTTSSTGSTTTTTDIYEGDHNITATYNGTADYNLSKGTLVQRFDNTSTLTTSTNGSGATVYSECNAGPVYAPWAAIGAFTPNPSIVTTANIPGTVSNVSVTLNNFYDVNNSGGESYPIGDMESLLVGPTGAALDFFSGASQTETLTEGAYSFSDSGAAVPASGTFAPGTYLPTDNSYSFSSSYSSNPVDAFVSGYYSAPAVTASNYSAPRGSATFSSTFGSTNPNGIWKLFFDENSYLFGAGAVNGWCVNLTVNAPTVAVALSHQGTGTGTDFVEGETNAQFTTTITNTGNGSTGDPAGNNPLVVTDTLNNALTYESYSGTGWTCTASGQAVTCKNDSSIAAGDQYPALTIDVNVNSNFTGSIVNTATASGAGAAPTTGSDTITVDSAPVLFLVKSHSGTFTQGSTAVWTLALTNAAANGVTTGQITVTDSLAAGYTLSSYTSTGNLWTCTGTSAVTCTASPGLSAGNTSTINLTVNVPANAPTTVSNTAQAYGGGDLVHNSPATADTATDSATVVQVPSTIAASSGNNQSATINAAFAAPLLVTVQDAGGNPISGQSVTFTVIAGANGQGGTFFTGTTATTTTNSSGQASETITADSKAGTYTVTAQAGASGPSTTFTLTNLPGAPATLVPVSGSSQSTTIGTAFPSPFVVLITDAGGNPVPGVSVTFNAPAGATPSATFSNAANSISVTTDATGQANSGVITANGILGGPYNVSAIANGFSTDAQLTNLGRSTTTLSDLTSTSVNITVFGYGITPPTGQLTFTDTTSGNPIVAPITLNTANATPTLQPMTSNSTGANTLPVWTEIADINGDGKPDLVASLYQTDSVSVQLGNGDGTFQPATNILIAGGFGPAEAHLVSLRGNGTMDLIVGSFNTNQVAVLMGNGDGTFQSPIFYSVGSSTNWPSSLTTGDFNHDGNLDIAAVNTGDNTVSVLYGNGSGSFTAAGSPVPVGNDPEAIRSGDFNGDGYSDLATVNYQDGTISILLSNGDGTFTTSTLNVGRMSRSGPQALAIEGSGNNLKLAVANYLDNTVSVLPGNGDGTFGTQVNMTVGTGPDDVKFVDINGDGLPDMVVTNYTSNNVTLLLAQSGGGYTSLGSFAVGNSPYSAAVGDVDLDGAPDIVTSNCFSNSTGTLLGGTQIVTSLTGLSLTPGDSIQATYTHDSSSKYADSSSSSGAVPNAAQRTLLRNGVQKSRRTVQHE